MADEGRRIRRTILALVVLGGLVGTVIVTQFYTLPVTTDGIRYDASARHLQYTGEMLVLGGGLVYPPGYPLFLASMYSLFGHSYTPVYIVQFMLVGLCGGLSFLIARRYLGVPYWLAVLVGILVLFWPYMVLHAMLLFSEVLGITLLIGSVAFLYRFVADESDWHSLAVSGILLGASTLTRPVSMLLPFWILILWTAYRFFLHRRLPSWRNAALYVVAFLLPMVGWSSYTYAVQGRIDGVYSLAPGVVAFAMDLLYEQETTKDISRLARTEETSMAESDDTSEDAPVVQPPLGSILVSKLKNVVLFWNPGAGGYQAQAYIDRYAFVAALIWLYRIGFLVLLGLAFMTLRRWREDHVALAWIVIGYFWAVHTVLFPFPRYMLPIVPLVLILAATTAHSLFPYFMEGGYWRRKPAGHSSS